MTVTRRTLITVAPVAALLLPEAAALAAVTSGSADLLLQPGVHRIDRDTRIAGDVRLEPGARIVVAAGATLALLGHFSAPIGPVFSGAGKVDLALGRTLEAYPEWWGARTEDGSDCAPAIDACLAAHPVMRLGPHSYFVSRMIAIERNNRHIIGSGQRWLEPGSGTRIVLTSGSGDVMRIGTLRRPPDTNNYVQGVMVSDLMLTRSVPAPGSDTRAGTGLRLSYCLYADISRVHSAEHVNAFVLSGVVRSYLRDCSAFRSPAGGAASSVFRGYVCDGAAEGGFAGGNASIYLVDCNASTGGQPRLTESVGLLLDDAFADTYAANFETAAMATGIRLSGKASGLRGDRRRSGHVDVRIVAPVLDQCSSVGIELSDISEHSAIDIIDPYVVPAVSGRAAMTFDRVRGMVSVRGGQLLSANYASGVIATDSDGIELSGVKLLSFREPVRMTRCRDFALSIAINQPSGGAAGPAILLTDCAEGSVAARIKGSAGAFPAGVAVQGASRALSIETATIRAETVGGEARRVMVAATGSQIDVRR